MKWFRFYQEVLHDPKIITLNPDQFRAWVLLLCVANSGSPRGTLPSIKEIACHLRMREDRAAGMVQSLVEAGLIETLGSGRLSPHNWESRQYRSDDINERSRKYRERRIATLQATPNGEPSDIRVTSDCNVAPNVAGNANATLSARTDSDSDSDSDGGIPHPLSASPLKTQIPNADLERVAAQAETLFPGLGFGEQVRALVLCGTYTRLDWLAEALARTRKQSKQAWSYVDAVYRGIERDGGIKHTAANGRPTRADPLPEVITPAEGAPKTRAEAARQLIARQERERADLEQRQRRENQK